MSELDIQDLNLISRMKPMKSLHVFLKIIPVYLFSFSGCDRSPEVSNDSKTEIPQAKFEGVWEIVEGSRTVSHYQPNDPTFGEESPILPVPMIIGILIHSSSYIKTSLPFGARLSFEGGSKTGEFVNLMYIVSMVDSKISVKVRVVGGGLVDLGLFALVE